ncbi:MAG TPA: protein kinase [Thermoanaerobaculia bacterium]|nr:protein kinase [Thermoanaerobaculia bacterium]
MVGTSCGPYRLLERVGEGGMGAVYRAEDSRNGVAVAVKVLEDGRREDPQMLSRFRREARIAMTLRHRNIAAFHDFAQGVVEAAGARRRRRVVYLVLEWVPGVDLAALLPPGEPLPVLYQMATGRLPFVGRNIIDVLRAVSTHEPAPPRQIQPAVPPRLEVLVLQLLAKERAARPASAEEVLRELEALV